MGFPEICHDFDKCIDNTFATKLFFRLLMMQIFRFLCEMFHKFRNSYAFLTYKNSVFVYFSYFAFFGVFRFLKCFDTWDVTTHNTPNRFFTSQPELRSLEFGSKKWFSFFAILLVWCHDYRNLSHFLRFFLILTKVDFLKIFRIDKQAPCQWQNEILQNSKMSTLIKIAQSDLGKSNLRPYPKTIRHYCDEKLDFLNVLAPLSPILRRIYPKSSILVFGIEFGDFHNQLNRDAQIISFTQDFALKLRHVSFSGAEKVPKWKNFILISLVVKSGIWSRKLGSKMFELFFYMPYILTRRYVILE